MGKIENILIWGTVKLQSSITGEQEGKGRAGRRRNLPSSGWERQSDKTFLIIAGLFYPFISLLAFLEWGEGFGALWSFHQVGSSALPSVGCFSCSHFWFRTWIHLQQLLAIRAPAELWLTDNLFTRPVSGFGKYWINPQCSVRAASHPLALRNWAERREFLCHCSSVLSFLPSPPFPPAHFCPLIPLHISVQLCSLCCSAWQGFPELLRGLGSCIQRFSCPGCPEHCREAAAEAHKPLPQRHLRRAINLGKVGAVSCSVPRNFSAGALQGLPEKRG